MPHSPAGFKREMRFREIADKAAGAPPFLPSVIFTEVAAKKAVNDQKSDGVGEGRHALATRHPEGARRRSRPPTRNCPRTRSTTSSSPPSQPRSSRKRQVHVRMERVDHAGFFSTSKILHSDARQISRYSTEASDNAARLRLLSTYRTPNRPTSRFDISTLK